MTDQPNSRYKHVFPVVRVDFDEAQAVLERAAVRDRVTVTKVFATKESAQREADRLNALSSTSESLYFVTYGRLVPDEQSC